MTTDCNFKCQYCYEDYHNHYQLNEKTLVDSLEFMMNYGDRGKVLIDFLGGEPLLKKDLIYKAVAYIKDNYPEREVKYYITTNCSMMDDRFIAFMKENHFTVRLSFDGNKETHDLNRAAKDGVSCYEKIFENIMKVKDSGLNFSVRMTVTENTIMAFNLMKDVVDYAKKKCQETNLICKFSTTINGTLVTDEVIDFFVENTFEVKVSLDGPEYVQNLNRRDYAGTGSFEKIMKNLPLLRKYEQETGNQISVASVVTSNNYQYYAESFQFLLDLGIKKLESGIDYYCSWSDEQIQGLREQIEKVFGLYKAHIQKNQEVIFWNLWEQYLKSFLIPCPFYACKAGLTTCYVTTDGGIYTCAELPEFKIGSVEAGLDVPRIREIIYLEDQEDTMCKECQYIRHCKTRGCQVANYEIHQNVYQPIKVNCEVTKWMYHLIQTNLTEKQLEKLKQEYERRYLRHGK